MQRNGGEKSVSSLETGGLIPSLALSLHECGPNTLTQRSGSLVREIGRMLPSGIKILGSLSMRWAWQPSFSGFWVTNASFSIFSSFFQNQEHEPQAIRSSVISLGQVRTTLIISVNFAPSKRDLTIWVGGGE